MNRYLCLTLCALAWLAVPCGFAQAQTPAPKGFDVFPLVKTRNIFDPTRKPMRVEQPSEAKASKQTRQSYFTLTGTMVADGRSLAFFSGSRAEFSKVLPVGDTVAGYKVVSITPLQAELERDGKSIAIAVGHRLQPDGSTDEIPAGEAASPEVVPQPSSNSNAPAAAPTAPPPSDADKAEILRRMMERRQKEMSK